MIQDNIPEGLFEGLIGAARLLNASDSFYFFIKFFKAFSTNPSVRPW